MYSSRLLLSFSALKWRSLAETWGSRRDTTLEPLVVPQDLPRVLLSRAEAEGARDLARSAEAEDVEEAVEAVEGRGTSRNVTLEIVLCEVASTPGEPWCCSAVIALTCPFEWRGAAFHKSGPSGSLRGRAGASAQSGVGGGGGGAEDDEDGAAPLDISGGGPCGGVFEGTELSFSTLGGGGKHGLSGLGSALVAARWSCCVEDTALVTTGGMGNSHLFATTPGKDCDWRIIEMKSTTGTMACIATS